MQVYLAVLLLSLFLVSPVWATTITDDFNRADEDPVAGWTTYGANQAVAVVSNRARAAVGGAGGLSRVYSNTATATNQQTAQVTLATYTNGGFGISVEALLRAATTPTDTTYMCRAQNNTNNTAIMKRVAGVQTSLASETSTTWAVTDTLKCIVNNTSLWLIRNGGAPLLAIVDSAIASGRVGFMINPGNVVNIANVEVDDFTGGDFVLPFFVAAGTEGSANSTTVSPGYPSSPATDDIVVCLCHASNQNAMTMDAAWTQIQQGNGGGTTSRIAGFWHRYAGSVPTMTITGTGTIQRQAGCAMFRGVPNACTPVPTIGTVTAGTDASMETSSISLADSLNMALVAAGSADDNIITLPAGYLAAWTEAGPTNQFNGTAGTPDGMVGLLYTVRPSGAWAPTITQAASDAWGTFLFALRATCPAVGAAPRFTLMGVGS